MRVTVDGLHCSCPVHPFPILPFGLPSISSPSWIPIDLFFFSFHSSFWIPSSIEFHHPSFTLQNVLVVLSPDLRSPGSVQRCFVFWRICEIWGGVFCKGDYKWEKKNWESARRLEESRRAFIPHMTLLTVQSQAKRNLFSISIVRLSIFTVDQSINQLKPSRPSPTWNFR